MLKKLEPYEKIDMFKDLIKEAQMRVGSFIIGGGKSDDYYITQQREKIVKWEQEIENIIKERDVEATV
jgi:hypothetical protein